MASTKPSKLGKRQRQRQEADRFLWHLESECRSKFSHRHWWTQSNEPITREAAFWELYRRHPDVSAVRKAIEPILARSKGGVDIRILAQFKTALACLATRDWSQLHEGERLLWNSFLNDDVGAQRGFTPEPVQVLGTDYPWVGWFPKRAGNDPDKVLRVVKESRLRDAALAAVRKGRIVLAIDPSARGIGKLVEEIIAKRNISGKSERPGKARINAWLQVIAAFEEAEMRRGKAEKRDDQLAARYRRTILDLKWPS